MINSLSNGGEIGELLRSIHWADTPLGPADRWSQGLLTTMRLCLDSPAPLLLWWGPELVLLANDPARPLFGPDALAAALGHRGREGWPSLWGLIGATIEGVLASGTPARAENLPLASLGAATCLSFAWSRVVDERGEAGVFCVVTDATPQVSAEHRSAEALRAEEALREREEHLRSFIELNPQVPWTADPQGRILEFNERWLRLTGLTREQALGDGWAQAPHPDDRPAMVAAWTHSIRTGAPYDIEHRIKLADGGYRWMRSRAYPRRDGSGQIIRWYGTTEDIHDRWLAKAQLRDSEEQFRLLVEGVRDYAIIMLDPDGYVVSWNTGAAMIKGYSADEIIGSHVSVFYPNPDDAALMLAGAASDGGYQAEGLRLRKSGEPFWAHVTVTALRGPDGTLRGFAKVTRDITARVAAENRLRESEGRLAGIVDSAMDAIITVDSSQRIVLFNRAAEQLFGYTAEEAAGMQLGKLIPDRHRAAHARHVRTFGRSGITTRSMHPGAALSALRRDQTEFPIEASISHITLNGQPLYTAIVRDISARKRLEAQLLQSQKMETVGRLAGGVAHDFNNLLTVIQGYAEFVRDELSPDSSVAADLRQVLGAAERATRLTRQLLAFARQQPLAPQAIDLNRLVTELVALLDRLLGPGVSIVTRLTPGLPAVRVDPGQIEQVLVNLCVNARDAMPDGGRLTIATAYAAGYPSFAPSGRDPDDYILFTVADTGHGMPPEVQAHLFEPFFTTKERGKGTGLGLATCYGIVTQHGGQISCVTAPGEGTAFSVALPIDHHGGGPDGQGDEPGQRHLGTERILLVEDDDEVRALAARILRGRGYTVVEAADAAAAAALVHQGGPIDLLLTDLGLPGAGGPALARALIELHPELPVLFISGSPDHPTEGPQELDPAAPLLPKPFTPDALAQAVRAALSGWMQK